VLVVQSNPISDSRISTVVIAAITSNIALAEDPGDVSLGRAESGLPKHSVVNVSQVLTVDKALLTDRVRALPQELMAKVNGGMRLVLGL
jgi:mRNA interferase MazF